METTPRATAEERALARAAVYRLLALAFAYPTPETVTALRAAADVAAVGAGLIDSRTRAAAAKVAGMAAGLSHRELESAYQRSFTLSYSADCPLYETAFSASHIFQQTQHQADIAGFYRAFGVEGGGERPDHLAVELEFLYLVSLKEARAREEGEREHVAVCRDAQRSFVRDHLGRWAPVIAGRIAVAGRGTFYAAAARLLRAFAAREEAYLRLGTIERFRAEPVLIADEPGEFTCPIDETIAPIAIDPPQVGEEAAHAPVVTR